MVNVISCFQVKKIVEGIYSVCRFSKVSDLIIVLVSVTTKCGYSYKWSNKCFTLFIDAGTKIIRRYI